MNQTQTQIEALDKLLFGDVDPLERQNLSFRRVFVDISKLLVERWLKTPRGLEFDKDMNDPEISKNPQERLKVALANQGIPLASWLTTNPKADLTEGSLTCDESKPGLAFLFNIPLRMPNENEVPTEVSEQWVADCQKWIDEKKYDDPEADFPHAPNNYIPLATS
jgi:hypothetical protein